MAQATPMQTCPMAKACRGMMARPLAGMFMRIPGIAFIVMGVLIFIWPVILPWLVAAGCIMMGIAMLIMPSFMRRMGSRIEEMHEHA